jgi:integrase
MGTIIPRGPRKWLIRKFLSSEVKDGRRVRKYASKTVTGTYATARAALAALSTEIHQGTYVPPSVSTLRQFVEWWLGEVVSQKCEGATQRSYRDRIRPYLDTIGHLKLDKVTTPVLQRALNSLAAERRWSRRTVRYTKTILGMALNEAVRQGLLRSNPCAALVLPRGEEAGSEERRDGAEEEGQAGGAVGFRAWTREQVQLFLGKTAPSGEAASAWYPLWHLLLNTGMRPGEAAGLQWTDLSGTDVTIQRAVKSDGKGGWIIGPPKTRKSRRTISLPEATLRFLRQHRNGQLRGFMFSPASLSARNGHASKRYGESKDYLSVPQMHAAWERDVERVREAVEGELPAITLYETRHTHLTLLLSLGIPVKVVSERAGHTGVEITLNTYTHVLPHQQAAVAEQLDRALGGAGQ